MADQAVDWRRRAAELRRSAMSARDAAVRELLLLLAEEYDELSAASEEREKGNADPA